MKTNFAVMAASALIAVSLAVSASTASGAAAAPPATPAAAEVTNPLTGRYAISSYFGERCMPLAGAQTSHTGLDMAAPSGTPIYAAADGVVTVTRSGTAAIEGYISIRHTVGGKSWTSMYFHVWNANTHVKVGQTVVRGQRISAVGTSGGVTGPHLHFVISDGVTRYDPAPWMKSRGVDLLGAAAAITAKASPATCTYYATSAVTMRSTASATSPIVATLPKGTTVTQGLGKGFGTYLLVSAGSRTGYVPRSQFTPNKPSYAITGSGASAPATPAPAAPAPAPAPAYKATVALNLRASNSTSSKVIAVVPKAASVGKILATNGVWRKVTYKSWTGWVHSDYITTGKVTAPAPAPAVTPTYKTTAALNLRASNSTSSKALTVIPKAAKVGKILATNGVWRKVTYKSWTGWVHSSYITKA